MPILSFLTKLFSTGRVPTPPCPDTQVIAQLRQAGSDLRKPHPIEFFFYTPTAAAADRLAQQLRSEGFAVQAQPAATGSDWSVQATKSLIPDAADMTSRRKRFEAMASAEQGSYDGWGTPVVG